MKPESKICTVSLLSQTIKLTCCASRSHYSTQGLRWFSLLVYVVRELLLLVFIERYFYSKSYGQLKAYQDAIP